VWPDSVHLGNARLGAGQHRTDVRASIGYSDPDALPINAQANDVPAAASRNGGFNQSALYNPVVDHWEWC
jgi:hypothetical protein